VSILDRFSPVPKILQGRPAQRVLARADGDQWSVAGDAHDVIHRAPRRGEGSLADADGLAVSQHEAVSEDGTRRPYFQVARHDLALNGRNPTLLYGYGGFEIALLPGYQAVTGAAWLEAGGVYVVANIRGGGEFGPRWHQAALQKNQHKASEDVIAVAEDLMR